MYDHVWYFKKYLPERKGHHCRVLARGGGGKVIEMVSGIIQGHKPHNNVFQKMHCHIYSGGEGYNTITTMIFYSPRNVLVEFEDGYKVVGTRFCVRKIKEKS